MHSEIVIAAVPVERIISLRHRVLRSGLPIDAAHFDGDHDPQNCHWAASIGEAVVGCATLHREPYDEKPAWRLRGMAVDETVRSLGVGRLLLNAIDRHADESGTRLLWCNARLIAVPFYEKLGWTIVSGLFDIPTAGPHHVMVKNLDAPA